LFLDGELFGFELRVQPTVTTVLRCKSPTIFGDREVGWQTLFQLEVYFLQSRVKAAGLEILDEIFISGQPQAQ
jgi:hypothetical protein